MIATRQLATRMKSAVLTIVFTDRRVYINSAQTTPIVLPVKAVVTVSVDMVLTVVGIIAV